MTRRKIKPKKHFTTGDIASEIGVTQETIRLWIASGTIAPPALVTPGGHRRFTASEFRRIVKKVTVPKGESRAVPL